MTPAQIRKDLSYFGEFGKQGMGYDVKFLYEQLRQILGVDREWLAALVGIGDLGHAIARYGGFTRRGFKIAALFDQDPKKIGQQIGELEIISDRQAAHGGAWSAHPARHPGRAGRPGAVGRRPDGVSRHSRHSLLRAHPPARAQGRPRALH